MLESVRQYVDIGALLVTVGFLAIVTAVGLWWVHRTTGRSYRDMLSVLAGAIIFIAAMVPSFYFFSDWLDSPDRQTRRLSIRLLSILYIPIGVAVWWVFNHLAIRRRRPKLPHKS